MTEKNKFLYLLTKYKEGTCTSHEYDEFFSLLLTDKYDDIVKENISDAFHSNINSAGDLPAHIAQDIVRNILSADDKVHQLVPVNKKRMRMSRWLAAACVLALMITGVFFYFNVKEKNNFTAIIPLSDIVKENKDNTALKIELPDATTVLLQPGGKIYYPAIFKEDKREVYLEGSAHFDVAHNAQKPFLVYCNNIVTKVLGTSFDVFTNQNNGDVEVAVKTGRVQVYENEAVINSSSKNNGAVILTANQRMLYSNESRKIFATLVEKPAPLMAKKFVPVDSVSSKVVGKEVQSKSTNFIYDQEKLSVVFDDIQRIYGIEMVVENTNIYNCVFTGDVSDKDLFVLLKIICLSTNSDYEVMGTKILIKGKGCSF